MRDYYIFDVAIYLKPPNQYYQEMDRATEKYFERLVPGYDKSKSQLPSSQALREEFQESFGGPWNFNQIVGWLRLYVEGSEIGGQIWWVIGRRLQPRMRKTFHLVSFSNVLPTWFRPHDSAPAIFAEVLTQIESLAKKPSYRKRYFDLCAFRRIGPFVDWRALMDQAARIKRESLVTEEAL